MGLEVDASNSCIPPSAPLVALSPPLPSTVRGEACVVDSHPGRFNSDRSLLVYGSGRLVIVREIDGELDGTQEPKVKAFVYRGHTAQVTVAKFSPSGCYVASADVRGKIRVWSYDNEEHLCKLDMPILLGPIRDVAWDVDSKRICIVGEGSKSTSSECSKVIQFDTGVSCGQMGQHVRQRALSCSFTPKRPMRIVTGGGDDSRCIFHKGPPFARVVDESVAEFTHARGAVNCVRYNNLGTMVASVGTDKSVCLYNGKTMSLIKKVEDVHKSSIYACDWSADDEFLLTCSGDGTAKLLQVSDGTVVHTWDVAAHEKNSLGVTVGDKTPMGGMQMGCAFLRNNIPVSIGLNGLIAILPLPSGILGGTGNKDLRILAGHQAPIACSAIERNSGHLIMGDTDGVISTYELESGTLAGRFEKIEQDYSDESLMNKIHEGTVTSVATAESKVFSVGWDDMVRISDGTNKFVKSIKLQAQPNCIASGTKLLAILTVEGLVLMKDESIKCDAFSLPYNALSVCVTSDDKTVIVGGEDCKIHIYSVSDSFALDEVNVIENAHLKPIHSVELSNNGNMLASADVRDVCVWSVPSGSPSETWSPLLGKGRWCFHRQRITCLAWSMDDTVLASGSIDDSIYLWSLAKKMKRIHYPFAHRGGISGLSFMKDAFVLISVGADSCVNQWDATNDVAKTFG